MKALLAFMRRAASAAPHDDSLRAGQFEPRARVSLWLAMLPYH